jgi:HEAT repeat protein
VGLFDRFFAPNIPKLEKRGDVDGIISALESGDTPSVRVEALLALSRSNDERRVALLVGAMADSAADVSAAAEEAVRDLGPAAGAALVEALDGPVGDRAAELMMGWNDEGVASLAEGYQTSSSAGRLRALECMVELEGRLEDKNHHEAVFSSLLAAIGDRSPKIRVAAAGHLKTRRDSRACRALAAQLKDGDESVRTSCREALAAIGEEAVPNLLIALDDRNANSRRTAAELLGQICGIETALESRTTALLALARHLGDGDGETASCVRAAVERIPKEDVVESQLKLFADEDRFDHHDIRDFLSAMLAHHAVPDGLRRSVERALERTAIDP